MLKVTLSFLLGVSLCYIWVSASTPADQYRLLAKTLSADLEEQLQGKSCRYEGVRSITPDFKVCVPRASYSILSEFLERHPKEHCKYAAAECMAVVKDYAHQKALLAALKTEPNVDTGDGIIHIRTKIIEALGELGDSRAITSLEAYIAEHPKTRDLFAERAPEYVKANNYKSREEYEPLEPAQAAIQKIKERDMALATKRDKPPIRPAN